MNIASTALTNGDYAVHGAEGTGNSTTRYFRGGVWFHASQATNPVAFLLMQTSDDVSNYIWVNDSDVLMISTSSGNIGTATGTVVGAQSSDERLKDNISEISYGLDDVMKLSPVEFDIDGQHQLGFGAQTTQPIIPEAVYDTKEIIDEDDPDNTKLGMTYVQIIPVLVKAVQELSAKVTALEG